MRPASRAQSILVLSNSKKEQVFGARATLPSGELTGNDREARWISTDDSGRELQRSNQE